MIQYLSANYPQKLGFMYTLQSDDALSTLAQTLENIACVVDGIVCVKAKFNCIAVTRSREAERGMGKRR